MRRKTGRKEGGDITDEMATQRGEDETEQSEY